MKKKTIQVPETAANGKADAPAERPAAPAKATETPAPTPAPELKPDPAAEPHLPPDVELEMRRMQQMRTLGKDIEKAKRHLEECETKVAEDEAALKESRADRNEAERAHTELLEDLAKLANGKFAERLPFTGGAAAIDPLALSGPAAPAAAPKPDPDAWKATPLADVWHELGGPEALLTALYDGKDKHTDQPAGIRTLGQIADYCARPHHRLSDIAGIGKAKAEKIEDLLLTWYERHPIPKAGETPAEPATATAPAPALLTWEESEGADGEWFAANTAGIMTDDNDDLLAEFVVQGGNGRFMVDASDANVVPTKDCPDAFPTLAAAQSWCELQNAALVAKGGNVVELTAFIPTAKPGDAERAVRAHLLPTLMQGLTADVETLIVGTDGARYLVTPPPVEREGDGDVYALRHVFPSGTEHVELDAAGFNSYAGRFVRHDGQEYVIGGTDDTVFVRDGAAPAAKAEAPAEPEPVEKPAKKAGKKKPTREAAAV